jgi:hypothetical protein
VGWAVSLSKILPVFSAQFVKPGVLLADKSIAVFSEGAIL